MLALFAGARHPLFWLAVWASARARKRSQRGRETSMGGLGSGPRKKLGRRTVDSTPVLDVNDLSAAGRLTPGWAGICRCVDDNGAHSIQLRAETDRLWFSWLDAGPDTPNGAGEGNGGVEGARDCEHEGKRSKQGEHVGAREGEHESVRGEHERSEREGATRGTTETILIVRTPCRHGGDRAYFVCPGPRAIDPHREKELVSSAGLDVDGVDDAPDDASAADTTDDTGAGTNAGDASAIAAVGCGRRVTKLYLLNRYFACRHCHRLVYASRYEQRPEQRALRRIDKVRQRFGPIAQGLASAGIPGIADAPERPKWMPVDVYARLLDELLRAETQAAEANTARIQRLLTQLEASEERARRRARVFTL